MTWFKIGLWIFGIFVVFPGSVYYGYALGDREVPYHRIYGLVWPVDPVECGLPPGPIPTVIHASGGDCLRQEWAVDRRRACNVVSSDPYVYRWLIDESSSVPIKLPVILSEQVGGSVPRMSKTFVGPPVHPGWVSYRARVDVACNIDAFGLRGFVNPLHLIRPIRIDHLSTEFRAE